MSGPKAPQRSCISMWKVEFPTFHMPRDSDRENCGIVIAPARLCLLGYIMCQQ